jgi:prepilin-type N-terminal cleavage/methylation domain-containing protein
MKKQFTLIEVLVVTTIIAILASMLLPSLTKAKTTSKRVVCVNNLKQVMLATVTYAMDHDGYMPAPHLTSLSWEDMLGAYDGRNLTDSEQLGWGFSNDQGSRHQIYVCPLDNPARLTGNRQIRSYAVNVGTPRSWRGQRGPIQSGYRVQVSGERPYSLRLGDAPDPTLSVAIFDYQGNNRLGVGTHGYRRGYDLANGFLRLLPNSHGTTHSVNFAYVDGGVRLTPFDETMGSRNLWSAADCRNTPWDWKQ